MRSVHFTCKIALEPNKNYSINYRYYDNSCEMIKRKCTRSQMCVPNINIVDAFVTMDINLLLTSFNDVQLYIVAKEIVAKRCNKLTKMLLCASALHQSAMLTLQNFAVFIFLFFL